MFTVCCDFRAFVCVELWFLNLLSSVGHGIRGDNEMYIGRLRGSQGVEDSVLFECGSFKNVFIIILWGHQGCAASVLLTKLSH